MARRVVRGARPKARYKWCGAHGVVTVARDTDLVISDAFGLCPSLSDAESQGDTTIERVILELSARRLLATDISGLGFIVQVMTDDETTALPSKVVNPLDQTNPEFTLGNKDVLLAGLMSYPPILVNGFTGTTSPSFEGMAQHFEFNGRRRLNRLNHSIQLWMASNTADDVISVAVTSRVLLRY